VVGGEAPQPSTSPPCKHAPSILSGVSRSNMIRPASLETFSIHT